jgi:hypothetical protein
LINGLITLQKKIDNQSIKDVSWYSKEPENGIPVPVFGPDIIDPRQNALIFDITHHPVEMAAESESAVKMSGEEA